MTDIITSIWHMKKTWTYSMSYMESVAKETGLEPWIPHSILWLTLGRYSYWGAWHMDYTQD